VISRHTISGAIALGIVCWLGLVVSAQGQAAAPAAAPLSDQVFKNVQVLKGIPIDQFMDAMGMFSSSLGYDCSSCHSQDIHYDRAAFATTTHGPVAGTSAEARATRRFGSAARSSGGPARRARTG